MSDDWPLKRSDLLPGSATGLKFHAALVGFGPTRETVSLPNGIYATVKDTAGNAVKMEIGGRTVGNESTITQIRMWPVNGHPTKHGIVVYSAGNKDVLDAQKAKAIKPITLDVSKVKLASGDQDGADKFDADWIKELNNNSELLKVVRWSTLKFHDKYVKVKEEYKKEAQDKDESISKPAKELGVTGSARLANATKLRG